MQPTRPIGTSKRARARRRNVATLHIHSRWNMADAHRRHWHKIEFDEERYVYLGDTFDEVHDPSRCGTVCDAVLRGDGSGRVLRGRNRNQAVRFPNGDIEIVPGSRLRLKEKYDPEPTRRG